MIEASLSCFLHHPQIAGIVVALHANDCRWASLNVAAAKPIYTVVGGDTRAQSVRNALQKLNEISAPQDFVLVHDAARPCLRYTDLDRLIQTLQGDDVGGILALPVRDTIKRASRTDGKITVGETLDRVNLWSALTPQMFRVKVLKKALDHCLAHALVVTDEARAVEALGLPVKLVEGSGDNIKITRPEDIELATAIVRNLPTSHGERKP